MSRRLAGKTIVVAGAGCIGDELALRYASEGASVVVGDLDAGAADRVVRTIADQGGQALATTFDGAEEASIAAMVDLAVSRYGALHGFHANYAGFAPSDNGDVLSLDMQDWDAIIRIDARGYVLCARAAIPAMLEAGGGSLIFTSSDAVYVAEPVRVSYAMAKAALHALMRHVARRFGPQGVRANVIAPGLVWHDKLEGLLPPEVAAGFKAATMLQSRLGKPSDIASVAALLMADEGEFITGQVINVSGGAVSRA